MPRFRYPFDGSFPVTSPYGPRDGGFHTGTDFGCPTGTPVLASAAGQVVYRTFEAEAGNTITIQHDDGFQTRYHHLESWSVEVGARVAQGARIALSDSTGDSTGPHLHFEIRPTPSTPADPMTYLDVPDPPDPIPDPHLEEPVMTFALICPGTAPVLCIPERRIADEVETTTGIPTVTVNADQRAFWINAIRASG